ncbi:MAG: TRAP transporter substrate-binding protein DctP [Burkholderiales bacterium]|nr:TRAP transporter substrate-binding protein DctP [Burkholderiales bacterium]
MISFPRRATLAALASLALTLPAAAQTPKVYRITHVFPASHYLWQQGGLVFANDVEKASGGNIKFETYPAGQLGKDPFALLASGLADIAIMPPSYSPEKLPLTSVAELPGFYSTACEGTTKLWNIAKPGATLDTLEYKPLNLRVLFVTVLPPYALMTTDKAIPNLDAVKGLKIRANGAAMDKVIRAIGAVPVRVSSPELYDSLTRGTVEGALFPYQGMPTYNLEKVLKHSVYGPQLGSGTVLFAMSNKIWSALPAETKEIFTKASAHAQTALCKWQDDDNAKVRAKIVAEDGHVIANLSPAEVARWNDKVRTVSADWAKDLDSAGKKGSDVLKAFQGAPAM